MLLKHEIIGNEIERVAQRYRSVNWEDKSVYADYLAQTYYYVSYSTRLLALAAGNLKPLDANHFRRYVAHISEEASHEKLAERDLKNMGASLNDYPELPQTRMFYETQYYKVEHLDPLALMGYILLLEAVAVKECPALTKKAAKLYGANCVSFIKVHGEEDPDHVEKALQVVEGLPAERLHLVIQNLAQSAQCLIQILDGIEERSSRKNLKTAA